MEALKTDSALVFYLPEHWLQPSGHNHKPKVVRLDHKDTIQRPAEVHFSVVEGQHVHKKSIPLGTCTLLFVMLLQRHP